MSKTILVERSHDKDFRIEVPDDATMTFGPFSPPTKAGGYDREALRGTLRVYSGAKAVANKIIGVFTDVTSFRDISLVDFSEKVAVEEGASIWKSDANGYERRERRQRKEYFEGEDVPVLSAVAETLEEESEEELQF